MIWLEDLTTLFFRPVFKKLDKRLKDLLLRSCQASGTDLYYALKVGSTTLNRLGYTGYSKTVVHYSLLDEAKKLVADFERVEMHKNRTYQYLLAVTKNCTTLAEQRNAIPESLIYGTSSYYSYPPRTQPETSVLEGKDNLTAEYQYLKPILEFYSVSGLLDI